MFFGAFLNRNTLISRGWKLQKHIHVFQTISNLIQIYFFILVSNGDSNDMLLDLGLDESKFYLFT